MLKIAFVGCRACYLLVRYADGEFREIDHLEIDFKFVDEEVNGKRFKMQIWDNDPTTAYNKILPRVFQEADVVIVLLDVTDMKSFESLNQLFCDIQRRARPSVIRVVCGTKSDATESRVFTKEMVEAELPKYGDNIPYYEVSAKTGEGVSELFRECAMLWLSRNPTQIKQNNGGGDNEQKAKGKKDGCIIC